MRVILFFSLWLYSIGSGAQAPDSVSARELEGHVQFLASDALRGRGNHYMAQAQAADYIAREFKKAGLQPFPAFQGYLQPFVLENGKPVPIDTADATPTHMHNVIGMLRGKTQPNEIVLVTAHYDHLGVEGHWGDSVYNGANDNASGTAAVLALARYFGQRGDNERTLLFCAFAGEELGLLGSQVLSKIIKPEYIVAGFNIEMIGMPQYGRNRFALTGAHYGDLPEFIALRAKKGPGKLVGEAHSEKQLFYRSDNYPFAAKGVPDYTFMSSDDDDRCYHQPCDEAKRLDYAHMQSVVRTIASVLVPVVQGTFTPKRIDTRRLDKSASLISD